MLKLFADWILKPIVATIIAVLLLFAAIMYGPELQNRLCPLFADQDKYDRCVSFFHSLPGALSPSA